MPMTDERRREYQELTGLTDKELDEAIGNLTLDDRSADGSGLSRQELEQARDGVRQVMGDIIIISAKYNKIARRTDREVATELDQAEIDTDRAFLEELIGDEYKFMNPFGDREGKQRTIDVILNGRILFENYGRGGYESVQDLLQVHGDEAVYINVFRIDAHAQAVNRNNREVYEHDLGGSYRTMNNFIYRDGHWQATACQMTQMPPDRDFSLLCHVGATVTDEEE